MTALELYSTLLSPQLDNKKEIKKSKLEIKLSLFAQDMTLYVENPKDSHKTIRTNKNDSVKL